MAKKILFTMLFWSVSLLGYANMNDSIGVQIDLQAGYINPSPSVQRPKSPVYPPTVYLENHTLTFSTTHPEYILYIKDENETMVYSTVVSEMETTVVLPAALSGSYEIVLVMGNWMFTGWIDLAGYAPTCKIPRKSKSV